MTETDSTSMSIWDHIEELRYTLVASVVWWALGIGGALWLSDLMFRLLKRPLDKVPMDLSLHTFGPPEAFIAYLKISLVVGFILALPMIMFHFGKFVLPGLKPPEKKWIIPVFVAGLGLFSAGVLFAYELVLPLALKFLVEINQNWGLEPVWRLNYYLSFVLTIFLVFGGGFEMPLVVTILARMGIASPAFLRQQRKYAIVALFAGAALLTPPDIVTQLLLALPLWLLYEVSILLAVVVYPDQHPMEDESD